MRRALGAATLAAIALMAWVKVRGGVAGELLWICYPAGAMVGAGVLFRMPRLAAVGFVFHLGMGFLGWLLDVIASRHVSALSVAVHVLPLVAGAAEARASGVPRWAPLAAWCGWLVLQALAYVVTDPALNVNVAHSVWPPFASVFESVWAYRAFNAGFAIPFLLGAHWIASSMAPSRESVLRVAP